MRAMSESMSIHNRGALRCRAGRLAALGLVGAVTLTLGSIGIGVVAVGAAPNQAQPVSGLMGRPSMPAVTQPGSDFTNDLPGSRTPWIVPPQDRLGHVRSGSVAGPLPQSGTSSKWSIEATPEVLKPQGSLLADACASPSWCVAVGYHPNSSGTHKTLAEVWNGTSWTVQTTPNPSGAISSNLSAVSCSSATACTAVGAYENNSGTFVMLAEVWNGTSWTMQTTPNPSGATGSNLNAVSCSSATACTAVGYYYSSSGQVTLAERWNGTSWTVQTTPNPSGATYIGLYGVSCSSATACTAVGSYKNSSGTLVTLAEVWNGTSWTMQTTPNPSGAIISDLNAVSCSSATACTAVGSSGIGSSQVTTLAEVWNGTSWTVQTTPNPSGATYSDLNAVSCSSATACTAVGYYWNGSGTHVTLAEAE